MSYSKDFLLGLYEKMLAIRLVEESFVEPILSGEVRCPVHLCSGQEAVAVGVCANLTSADFLFGNHRSHGHFLAKGGTLAKLVYEIYCRENGASKGRGGSMHLIDMSCGMLGSAPIVGGTISLALGAAMAGKVKGKGQVAVSFFGDGATGEGALFESLNFAALKKLPAIFVCENNLYSTHMPIDEIRINRNIAEAAIPLGVKSFSIDGNDVLKVYETLKSVIQEIRTGMPILLECKTYRLRGHVGPDDNIQGTHTDIRPMQEIAQWREKDPIVNLSKTLLSSGLASDNELELIKNKLSKEIQVLHNAARKLPSPNAKDLKKYVFAE